MNAVELVSPSLLFPASYNPRVTDTARLDLVRLSLQKLGFLLPLVATPEGELLSGHQRHLVAMRMGAPLVPVLRVNIPATKRRGVNILFNRATNDISTVQTEHDMTERLMQTHIEALGVNLPDIAPDSPAYYPCCALTEWDVPLLARQNVNCFIRHAGNVGRMLTRMHIDLPLVITPDGTVLNGIGRLEAAARKGKQRIQAVCIDPEKALFAQAMLNYLSMDFHFTGENADFLRYGAYRRAWLKRTHFGSAFVIPFSTSRRNADFDINNPEQQQKWKSICGETVLDFGSGQGDEANMLRKVGINVTTFEPYPAIHNYVSRTQGKDSARTFLNAVQSNKQFSAIFLSSVLNSVPFPEDREHLVCLCAALCSAQTVLFAGARGQNSSNWHWLSYGEGLSNRGSRECTFKLAYEKGAVLGDITNTPKIQKFFSDDEFREVFSRFFATVHIGHKSSGVTASCRDPLPLLPQALSAALRFEFNLPYADGQRMNLVQPALNAFSARLGINLGVA